MYPTWHGCHGADGYKQMLCDFPQLDVSHGPSRGMEMVLMSARRKSSRRIVEEEVRCDLLLQWHVTFSLCHHQEMTISPWLRPKWHHIPYIVCYYWPKWRVLCTYKIGFHLRCIQYLLVSPQLIAFINTYCRLWVKLFTRCRFSRVEIFMNAIGFRSTREPRKVWGGFIFTF
jgi:hypothetical protein